MRKNRILSIFLCIAVVLSMFSGIFTNTPTAKADGTSGRDSVGHFSGGNYKVASSVGFGLKFSLKKRSRVLALHSPRNKKVLMNTMYDEDIASAFLCVSFNADGDVAWGKDNSKFRMVCVRRHIVGGTYRTLISVQNPLRLCRTGICRSLSAG